MKEPDPITMFVRHLLNEWRASGKTFTDLARDSGLTQSMISQIYLKHSLVTFYTADKMAEPLGFRNFFDMARYAELWLEAEKARDAMRGKRKDEIAPPPKRVSPLPAVPDSAPVEETGVRPNSRFPK